MLPEERLFRTMRVIRALGALGVLLIALAGAPQAATAFECEPEVIACTTVAYCVAHLEDGCELSGEECSPEIVCDVASNWEECSESGFPVAMVCKEVGGG